MTLSLNSQKNIRETGPLMTGIWKRGGDKMLSYHYMGDDDDWNETDIDIYGA